MSKPRDEGAIPQAPATEPAGERGREDPPDLTVVVAAVSGDGYLDRCLSALADQQEQPRTEIVVVHRDRAQEGLAAIPGLRTIRVSRESSLARMLELALRSAGADIVALTEDHCVPRPDWCRSIVAAHAAHDAVAIGGTVENIATERTVDWATFLCEYSHLMPPMSDGAAADLPLANVSYKKEALLAHQDLWREGYRETFLHRGLRDRGLSLRLEAGLSIAHCEHLETRDFVRQRFVRGREFATRRAEAASPLERALYVILAPILPPVLLSRIAYRSIVRGRLGALARSLPLLMLFTTVWSFGELLGYAAGSISSPRKRR